MRRSLLIILLLVCAWAALVTVVVLTRPAPSVSALSDPCAADPNNLTTNGSIWGPGYSAPPYGVVADSWTPFVISPVVPTFEWVGYNAVGDTSGTGSQYIWADLDAFDAGIYQTINNLTPGIFYRFWLGFALAAYDPGDQRNYRNSLIGRQVGIDLIGGTNPTAPSVQWGNVYWDGIAALNIPDLSMTFAAQANRATIFLRVVNQNVDNGRSKVWFDSVCMEQLNPQPNWHQFLPVVLSPAAGLAVAPEHVLNVTVGAQGENGLPAMPPTSVPTVTRTATLTPAQAPTPTSLPAPTPVQTSTPTMPNGVSVREDTVTLDAYPYEAFWSDTYDSTYNIWYKEFDWVTYSSVPRTPVPKTIRTVILENTFLRLMFLPDIGGRLWQILYKPTGQTVFYNNRVLKPTPWGPLQQRGWLGVGGMEWALPVDEHGYEWGTPWAFSITGSADRVTLTLQDTQATDRVRAQIAVTLPADVAYVIIHPRVENPSSSAAHLQVWLNAQVALDSKNVSSETEFVLPASSVFVHSTEDDFIPNEHIPTGPTPAVPMAWPLVAGHNLTRYHDWDNYLGVFATAPLFDFVGAYDHSNDLGIVRVFPPALAPGVKLFGWGTGFPRRDLFTDDGSDYFELWGGLPRTFFRGDDVILAAGESREWDEYWIPFARIGGLSAATQRVVLSLRVNGTRASVGAIATTPETRGVLLLLRDGVEIKRWNLVLEPGSPFREELDVPSGSEFRLRFVAEDGMVLAETQ